MESWLSRNYNESNCAHDKYCSLNIFWVTF